MQIKLYVCPTDGCNNYYGASSMGDMTKMYTGPKTENRHQVPASQSPVGIEGVRHTLAACPDCRQRGIDVERELRSVIIPPRRDKLVKKESEAVAERAALASLHS